MGSLAEFPLSKKYLTLFILQALAAKEKQFLLVAFILFLHEPIPPLTELVTWSSYRPEYEGYTDS